MLLQKDVKSSLTLILVHKDAIFDINESLARAAKLSLRLPLPDKKWSSPVMQANTQRGTYFSSKITQKPTTARRRRMHL